MATLPDVKAGSSDLAGILSILPGLAPLFDKTTTTKGTESSTVSQEGMNAMLRDLLSGNQGLASVLSGEKSAGLYNSSTNTLLANDLVSRMLGQVAQLNRTNKQNVTQTQQKQMGAGEVGLAAILKNLGKIQYQFGGDKAKKGDKSPSTPGSSAPTSAPNTTGSTINYPDTTSFADMFNVGADDNYGYGSGAGSEYSGLDYNWGWEGAQMQDPWFADNGFGGGDYNYIDSSTNVSTDAGGSGSYSDTAFERNGRMMDYYINDSGGKTYYYVDADSSDGGKGWDDAGSGSGGDYSAGGGSDSGGGGTHVGGSGGSGDGLVIGDGDYEVSF